MGTWSLEKSTSCWQRQSCRRRRGTPKELTQVERKIAIENPIEQGRIIRDPSKAILEGVSKEKLDEILGDNEKGSPRQLAYDVSFPVAILDRLCR
jgi:hypothetical protein